MNSSSRRCGLRDALLLWLTLAILGPTLVSAQWPASAPTTPSAQHNALNAMRGQIKWFQNATRTAPNYGEQGYGNVWGAFQSVRQCYNGLKGTLNSEQQAKGANALAELDAGLDIILEAFTNYQQDVAAGRDARTALRDMCQVLRQASDVWLDELNKTCSRLRVG